MMISVMNHITFSSGGILHWLFMPQMPKNTISNNANWFPETHTQYNLRQWASLECVVVLWHTHRCHFAGDLMDNFYRNVRNKYQILNIKSFLWIEKEKENYLPLLSFLVLSFSFPTYPIILTFFIGFPKED